jgi:phosphoserine phosphatase RsbU/P
VLVTVGDVVGKGVEAAVRTSRITQTLRALALRELPLDQLLALADEQVVWQDPEIMATLWCGMYEPDTGELAFASLGHPPALLLRSSGDPIRLELEGLPLGMRDLSPDPPEVCTRRLDARDLLVLYTDGVVEASREPCRPLRLQYTIRVLSGCNSGADLNLLHNTAHEIPAIIYIVLPPALVVHVDPGSGSS